MIPQRDPRQDPGAGNGNPDRHAPFRVADAVVHPVSNEVRFRKATVRLEPKAMDVLCILADHAGNVVSRDALEKAVWPGRVVGYDALTGAIQKIRRVFGDDPRHPQVIETISKRGYRLVAPVLFLNGPVGEYPPPGDLASPVKRAPASGAARLWTVILAVVAAAVPGTIATIHFTRHAPPPPSLAVLPFNNLGGNPEYDYFAHGISDDLIAHLTDIPGLRVIARDSSMYFAGRPPDVAEVSERLRVRYVVRGSVRHDVDRVRLSVELVDADTGHRIWFDRSDTSLEALFGVLGRMAVQIAAELDLAAGTGLGPTALAPSPTDAEAYDRFLRGRQRFYLYANKEQNQLARALFEATLQRDPEFAPAYAMLGWTHAFDAMNGWSPDREASLRRATDLATLAIERQADLPVAYFVRGLAHRERKEYSQALKEAEQAITLDPNYAHAHVLLATLLYYDGRPREGLERIVEAMRLNPLHPYNYNFHLGQAYFVLGRYPDAIQVFQEGLSSNPASERLHTWLAAAYAQSGRLDEAQWEAEQVLTLNPEFSRARMRETFPFGDPADLQHFLNGLRKAGLP